MDRSFGDISVGVEIIELGGGMRTFVLGLLLLLFPSFCYSTSYSTPPFIEKVDRPYWEHDAFVLHGGLYRAGFKRDWAQWTDHSVIIEKYDVDRNVFYKVGELAWGNALGSTHVKNGELYVFGTTNTSTAGNSIKVRKVNIDTWTWQGSEVDVYTAPPGVKIYNTSVTRGSDKWIIAYETDEGVAFSLRFLQSNDFSSWSELGGLFNSTFYSACPSINYVGNGKFIVTYMWRNQDKWETAIARTSDFSTIETFQGNPSSGLTPYQQLLSPDGHEGNNNSDFSMTEYDGRVYMVYLIGDQSTWGSRGEAWFNGTMQQLYDRYWSD